MPVRALFSQIFLLQYVKDGYGAVASRPLPQFKKTCSRYTLVISILKHTYVSKLANITTPTRLDLVNLNIGEQIIKALPRVTFDQPCFESNYVRI